MTLLRRILAEYRRFVLPLAVAAAANVAAYALIVYPLGVKAANAASRAEAAAAGLRGAEAEHAAAEARVASRTRAERELGTFYGKVLPTSFAAARRLTYTTIPDLAQKSNVTFLKSSWEQDQSKTLGALGHWTIRVVLQGDYGSLRQFIYNLETSPQFVIIDDVTLTQADANRPLTLTLELSTYYRRGTNGA